MKKIICILLIMITVLSLLPMSVLAETGEGIDTPEVTEIASGICGETAQWVLSLEGVLTISGSGSMTDYTSSSPAPWYSYRDAINKIEIKEVL